VHNEHESSFDVAFYLNLTEFLRFEEFSRDGAVFQLEEKFKFEK
jgi:hypothetical protein